MDETERRPSSLPSLTFLEALNEMERRPSSLSPLTFLDSLATVRQSNDDETHARFEGGLVFLPPGRYLNEARHEFLLQGGPAEHGVAKWRMNNRDRMRTGSVALVLCLNIGVDPPDVIKLAPCARLECWIDPPPVKSQKALEAIGKKLQEQYERWQPRAQCKVELDPTFEQVKELCRVSRRSARSERVLFHYNGHGVPKPTDNGEIWLFNRTFTQYIPLSVFELESWLGSPSIYVFDCSAAGLIVKAFCGGEEGTAPFNMPKDCIMLAACGSHETLPQSPNLPADVFTSCLTTPIKMALKWFCKRSLLKGILDPEMIDKIPGRQPDRKTPLGELNWIFTAITDTIAWNVLPRELFQRLFRQDLLVASLFRNFLLAERIMRTSNCTPISLPKLPSTHQHHMWQAWDLAAEMCLAQLPGLLADPNAKFQPSPFFENQLTAFEVWLEYGSERKAPPEQLPIILQVLLSQPHRYRALVLLGKFLDMGAWAVNLALSVGIFPCVLKLLQTTAAELRPVLVFIWTKILALDKSCQADLVKDNGHMYFIRALENPDACAECAMAAFVLTVIVDSYAKGQKECIDAHLPEICISHLQELNADYPPLLGQWLCLCLAKLWDGAPEAQRLALQDPAYADAVARMLTEPHPEVRAAATYALGCLIGMSPNVTEMQGTEMTIDEHDDLELRLDVERKITLNLLQVVSDGSPLVRTELCVALARLSHGCHNVFMRKAASEHVKHLPIIVPAMEIPATTSSASASASSGRPIPGNSFSSLSAIIPLWGGSSGSADRPSSFDSSQPVPARSRAGTSGSGSAPGRSRSLSEGAAGVTSPASREGVDVDHAEDGSEGGGDANGKESWDAESMEKDEGSTSSLTSSGEHREYLQVMKMLFRLAADPNPHVALLANNILVCNCGVNPRVLRPMSAAPMPPTARVTPLLQSQMTPGAGILGQMPNAARSSSPGGGSSFLTPTTTFPALTRNNSWAATSSSGGGLLRGSSDFISPGIAAAFRDMTGGRALLRSASTDAATSIVTTATHAHSQSVTTTPGRDAEYRQPTDTPEMGTNAGTSQNSLPYLPTSTLYQWSCNHFSKPMYEENMEIDEDMIGVRERRERVVLDGIAKCQHLSVTKVSDQIAQWDTESNQGTKALLLHPFVPIACIADDKETIRVWNYEEDTPLVNRFENIREQEIKSGVSRMCLLNELSDPFLLVASSDGGVRVWRNYMEKGNQQLVTAWQAMQLSGRHPGAPCVADWDQLRGYLYASGDSSCINVWDLQRECIAARVLTQCEGAVSCITASKVHSSQVVAGFSDGSVRIFDMRAQGIISYMADPPPQAEAPRRTVVGVDFEPGGDSSKLICAYGGSVYFMDMRNGPSNAITTRVEPEKGHVTSFAVHAHVPVLATGSYKQVVTVYNTRGEELSIIRYHNSFLGQRIGPVSCLQFHPYSILLAAGASDSIVSMYAGETR